MKTREDLILATLKLLQADGGAGQQPEAEDVQEIDSVIDGKLAELNAREVYYAQDKNAFDDEVVPPLSIVIANEVAPVFGQPRNPESRREAEAILRSFKPSTYVVGSILAVDYF
ncbi:hypothetical protein LH464_21320 [Neorhizobium sp. T786]|uniref:hypothetical protein n=1 Tax=Pseudorhizobium xiangyangii TaxID=2883104 RepID=UPI001CFFBA3C|nr:hypothetical protein [Neorhizobium xiangyangii]MCB5205010.1 hypothetical protein [Neorhizobium xiangyangii]